MNRMLVFDAIFKAYRGIGVLRLIGAILAISAIHVLGLSGALGPAGTVILSPVNASIVTAQLGFAYVQAMAVAAGFAIVFSIFEELREIYVARREKRKRRWLADYSSEREYFFSRMEMQITLTAIFYAWHFWLLSIGFLLAGFVFSWLLQRMKNYFHTQMEDPEFEELYDSSDNHAVDTYLKRYLQTLALFTLLIVAFSLGPLRLSSIEGRQSVYVTVADLEFQGDLVYRLHDGVILRVEGCGYLFVGDSGLVISDKGRVEKDADSCL